MDKLGKLSHDINKNYAVVFNDVFPPYKIAKKLKFGRDIIVWNYLLNQLKIGGDNKLIINNAFRIKGSMEALGYNDNSYFNSVLRTLLSLDFLKYHGRNNYTINPILAFKQRLGRRAIAILNYYNDYTPKSNLILDSFAKKHGSIYDFFHKVLSTLEEMMESEGYGKRSYDPQDIANF